MTIPFLEDVDPRILKVAGFVGLAVIVFAYMTYKRRHGKADLESVGVVDNMLVTISSMVHSNTGNLGKGAHYSTRIVAVDMETGNVKGRKILAADYEKIAIVNGILWMEPNPARDARKAGQQFTALDLNTMDVVLDEMKLKKKFGIPSGEVLTSMKIDSEARTISITSNNGDKHHFEFKSVKSEGAELQETEMLQPKKKKQQKSTRFTFTKKEGTERYNVCYNNHVICEGTEFMNPRIVHASENESGGDVLLVTHSETLSKDNGYSISVVNSNGTVTKTKLDVKSENNQPIQLRMAGRYQDNFVFVTKNGEYNKAISVNGVTGKVGWHRSI